MEVSGFHPRLIADNPNVLDAAGVSRKLLTPELLREATRASYPSAVAWCNRHNRLVRKGTAVGLAQVKEYDWYEFGVQHVPKPKPEPEATPCPSPPKKPVDPRILYVRRRPASAPTSTPKAAAKTEVTRPAPTKKKDSSPGGKKVFHRARPAAVLPGKKATSSSIQKKRKVILKPKHRAS